MEMMGAAKTVPPSRTELYERDYYAWILDQVRALRERRIEDVDWENVAEEIEDLGKSEKRALVSEIARLLEHLLKFAYAPAPMRDWNMNGWRITAEDARRKIRRRVKESPSLAAKLDEAFAEGYEDGRTAALIAMRLPKAIPETCPWTIEQAMDDGFLPAPRE